MEWNIWALALAIVAGVAVGALWFGPKTFFPVWWVAIGKNPDEQPGSANMGFVFGLTFLGTITQAVVLWVVLQSITAGDPLTWWIGLAVGSLVGVGFAAATRLSHVLFAGLPLRVWVLESGADIVGLTVMGTILGALG